MALALITTGLAGRHAGFDHRAKDGKIRRGLTRHDPSGSGAGVGAIEAKTDAAHHLANIVLREIGVGTTCTAGTTVQALLDTANERLAIDAYRLRMCLYYVFNCQVPLLSRSDRSAQAGAGHLWAPAARPRDGRVHRLDGVGPQPLPSARSSSTVRSAVGRASRRASGIGTPLSIDRP